MRGSHAAAGGALPPVAELAVGALALIVTGGIYMAANIPGPASLAPAIGLLAAAILVLLVAAFLMLGIPEFAWRRFRQVGLWALLAYSISAGMLELVFALDRVPAAQLLLLTLMLLVYAVDIPLILAYSVASHQTGG